MRGLGELRILTRVSYISLVLVPLLSSMWPAVRITVNGYNHAIREASEHCEHAARALGAVAERKHAGDATISSASTLTDRVQRLRCVLGGLTMTDPYFPKSLALAFYAALLVVLAHFFYESQAPRVIAESREEAFAAKILEGFREDGPDKQDRLRRAQEKLRALQAIRPDMATSPNVVKITRYGDTVEIPVGSPEAFWARSNLTAGNLKTEPGNVELMRIAIEEGARAEYQLLAREHLWFAHVSAFLYLAAMLLIAWIALIQAVSIWESTGFWGARDRPADSVNATAAALPRESAMVCPRRADSSPWLSTREPYSQMPGTTGSEGCWCSPVALRNGEIQLFGDCLPRPLDC